MGTSRCKLLGKSGQRHQRYHVGRDKTNLGQGLLGSLGPGIMLDIALGEYPVNRQKMD